MPYPVELLRGLADTGDEVLHIVVEADPELLDREHCVLRIRSNMGVVASNTCRSDVATGPAPM